MTTKTTPYPPEDTREKFLISTEDYHRMGEAGIFDGKPRVELINGNIFVRSPVTPYHNSHVGKGSDFFHRALSVPAIVWTQNSVRLDEYSEPEPDIAILRFREDFYSQAHPSPDDIHLLIEVAVETVQKDRTLKLRKYAQAGIPEYWIVIPKEETIEVYRNPEGEAYLEKNTYGKEDEWRLETFNLPVRGVDLLI